MRAKKRRGNGARRPIRFNDHTGSLEHALKQAAFMARKLKKCLCRVELRGFTTREAADACLILPPICEACRRQRVVLNLVNIEIPESLIGQVTFYG